MPGEVIMFSCWSWGDFCYRGIDFWLCRMRCHIARGCFGRGGEFVGFVGFFKRFLKFGVFCCDMLGLIM